MRQAFSLLNGPLKTQLKWQERLWVGGIPADQSVPNAPVVPQYAFRPGGFWQTQKALLFPTPADQSIPNAPVVPQYVFRKGRLWKLQRAFSGVVLADPVIPPAPIVLLTDMDAVRRPNYRKSAWVAAWSAGMITDEEFVAFMNAEKN